MCCPSPPGLLDFWCLFLPSPSAIGGPSSCVGRGAAPKGFLRRPEARPYSSSPCAELTAGFNRAVLDIAQPAAGAATPERRPLRTPWFPPVDVLLRLNVPRRRRKARLKPDPGAVRAANVATDECRCGGVIRLLLRKKGARGTQTTEKQGKARRGAPVWAMWHRTPTVPSRSPNGDSLLTENQPLAAAPADVDQPKTDPWHAHDVRGRRSPDLMASDQSEA